MLAGPRKIVVQKEADRTVGCITHLVGADIRVIDRTILALDKAQTEQPPGCVERRLDEVVEREIRLYRRFINRVFRLSHLFGVIAPIPALNWLVEAVGAGHRLQFGALLRRLALGGLPDLTQ